MDYEKILAGLVRVGTVMDVDETKRMVRVKYQGEGITSGWLYVLQHLGGDLCIEPDGQHSHSVHDTYTGGGSSSAVSSHNHTGSHIGYWMPKINDRVLALYLPIWNGDGFVVGGISQ